MTTRHRSRRPAKSQGEPVVLSITTGRRGQFALAGSVVWLGLLAGCTSAAQHSRSPTPNVVPREAEPTASGAPSAVRRESPAAPVTVPTLAPGVSGMGTVGSAPVVTVRRIAPAGPGQGAISIAVFNPEKTQLVLHAGSLQPLAGGSWSYGPQVSAQERTVLLAAFNGGFKIGDARGGWVSEGRTVAPLVPGAASVVIYADGGTDIGTWGVEVPAAPRKVVSVRQNLQLLIDGGLPQHVVAISEMELEQWWGVAYAGAPLVSRSALGITASGALVWGAGTDVTVAALADALLAEGVQRALELDINAPLVRGFLYTEPAALTSSLPLENGMLPLVAGQTQPAAGQSPTGANPVPQCTYLTTCSRDFFTVLIRNSGDGRVRPA
jgi:hypothetical protein